MYASQPSSKSPAQDVLDTAAKSQKKRINLIALLINSTPLKLEVQTQYFLKTFKIYSIITEV